MLQKLVIRNYAIIDNLSLAPDPGLNIVTGETGAGKSIILGALSLILGERADTSVLIHKEEKCFVEAHFEVASNETFRAALRHYELDDEPQCIIRREITASGKSRAFVNDTPVNLATLNKLTSLLVDLHQQFDHLALESDRFQLDVLDAIAKQSNLLERYQQQYTAYRRIGSQLAGLQEKQASWQKEADYKQYLLDELNNAHFGEGEVEEADAQLKTLQHAERIRTVLQSSRYLLDEGEQPLINELKKIGQQMQSITDVLPDASPLLERLLSAHAELKDICGELEDLESRTNLDAELMQTLQDRLDLGYKLFKKHGVLNTAGLLELQQRLSDELQETLNLSATIESLQAEGAKTLREVAATAQKLSAGRKKVAPEISKRVTELLALVGMPNAKFNIVVSPLPEPGPYGADEVAFLLDANRSGRFQPLHKAASGGEMSRIMLSIKSLTAEAVSLPTLIFDEVDTGISGEAARQVGYLLRELAQYHQVICITHQPQVAARGSRHFYVYKDADASARSAQAPQRITTKVRQLAQDERVLAIARMIGGEQPSEAALQNARELVVS